MKHSRKENYSKEEVLFPQGFLWGTATSSHQIEGGNVNNWSEWEKENANILAKEAFDKYPIWQQREFPEMLEAKNYISGKACDHFNRFDEDFNILEKLNQNAYRFSLEWSRIEPEEGVFNKEAVAHYRKQLLSLKKRNIKPMVTLWHWTNPLWLQEKGGESSRSFPFYFERYSEFIAKKLGDLVHFWITLNEPTTVIANGYFRGTFPPSKKSPFLSKRVFRILARSHNKAYKKIHDLKIEAKIGFANYFVFYDSFGDSWLNEIIAKLARHFGHREFFNLTKDNFDFLGVQYYGRVLIKFPAKFIRDKKYAKVADDLGWEVYPKGLYYILRKLKKYNKPIYITESGLADAKDTRREAFIKNHLYWINRSMQEGVDVRGYFYWSLMDNFEWDKGFWPRFGLVEINFENLERRIRRSAFEYARIAKTNRLEINKNEPQ
jgi:beta-glucosidase